MENTKLLIPGDDGREDESLPWSIWKVYHEVIVGGLLVTSLPQEALWSVPKELDKMTPIWNQYHL